MTAQSTTDQWNALSRLDPPSREQAMRQHFERLLELTHEERSEIEAALLTEEAELEPELHAAMTLSRLRTWMTFEANEVQHLASALNEARDRIPGEAAMRHVAGVQAVIEEIPAEQLSELIASAPALSHALPQEFVSSIDSIAQQDNDAHEPQQPVKRRRFWEFWR